MVRKIVGKTIPASADMGTIRGDFSVDSPTLANRDKRAVRNLIHASGNKEEAEHELSLWFANDKMFDYERSDESTIF
jgi:nucleoside-diphosphate kinase